MAQGPAEHSPIQTRQEPQCSVPQLALSNKELMSPNVSSRKRKDPSRHPPPLQDLKGKVLLPRPDWGWPQPSKSPKRTSHACDRCRTMKIRCSGGVECKKCVADDQACVYGDGKRERDKKDFAESQRRIDLLEEENRRLVKAVRTLRSDSQPAEDLQSSISELLAKYPVDRQSFNESRASSSVTNDAGETTTSARVGSPGAQDELSSVVELGSGAGAAGFVGKVSEVSWIQRCWEILFRQAAGEVDVSHKELDVHLVRAQDLNYHMDDVELLSIDEDHVDAFGWPPLETAKVLSEAYFHSLHHVFPFIDQDQFQDVMNHFPRYTPGLYWDERRWLSMANLIFGLGSKWLHLASPDLEYGSDDHLVYYARARALGLDHRTLFDHPTLEQVQALGLLALYLFVNNSIARSWTILGHAIRHATALGLQLRVTARSISTSQKSTRARTWYALYSLEITLAEFTGRPCSVTTSDISAPIVPMREDAEFSTDQQALLVDGVPDASYSALTSAISKEDTRSAHFSCRVQLSILSHRICSSLYGIAQEMSWSDVQDLIRRLDLELQGWNSRLPAELTVVHMQTSIRSADPKIELAMYYWSVRMILFRPCLCDMEGRIKSESKTSQKFNQTAAAACVAAALTLLNLAPESPEISEAYRILPWWVLLHYICQATAVLLLELCLGAQHCPSQVGEIMAGLRKALSYLRMMSGESLSAFKAWRVCRQLLADVTSRFGLDTSDVPSDAPQPPGWNTGDEALLAKALHDTAEKPVQVPTDLGEAE